MQKFDLEMIFDSPKKIRLKAQMETQLGTVVIGSFGIGEWTPNMCGSFMQGVTRQITAAKDSPGAIWARSKPGPK